MEDLADLPTVWFTQERMSIYAVQENLVVHHQRELSQMFNVTDRATLNGILSGQMPMTDLIS